jgi:uncharacterized protein (UPF0548 family)
VTAAPFSHGFAPGTVLTDEDVPGYTREAFSARVGGAADLERLGDLLLSWQVQRRSGIRVLDASGGDAPAVAEGLSVLLDVRLTGVGGLQAKLGAPVRVVTVLRGAETVGFVYGTLPDHPERGEEAFLLHRRGEDVVLEVRVLSRPAMPYALLAPLAKRFQRRATDRYLAALVGA